MDGVGDGEMGRVMGRGRVQGGEGFEVWWDAAVMGHDIQCSEGCSYR